MRLLLSALERLNVDVRPLVAGLPVGEHELRALGNRVDWDVWVTLMERLERQLGDPALLEDVVLQATAGPGRHPFQRVAQLISSPTSLYRLNSRWGIPNQFRHMRSECTAVAPDMLRISITIPESYDGSVPAFRASLGVLRGLPKIVGLPESAIVSREISPHGLVAVLKPPAPRTLLSYARRVGHRIRGLESMIEQLGAQEIELDEKSSLLERRVAEQAVVEAALRSSEERWRALAENAPGIILLLSSEGVIRSANRDFHGEGAASLIGKRLVDLVRTAHRRELADAIAGLGGERAVRDVQLCIERPAAAPDDRAEIHAGDETPSERWYACRLGPLGTLADDVTICAFLTDITERLRAERDLREREVELARAQKLEALGRLAGGVAHDFNNILTVILGGLELLLHRPTVSSELAGELREIRDAGERAAALTRQLLAFSRQQVIAPEVLNLGDVVKQVTRMLSRLLGEDIQLEYREEDGLLPVKLDRTPVEQILMNLVVNARDAMPRGGSLSIMLRNVVLTAPTVFAGSTAEAGSYVELAVQDTGLGMDVRTTARIFEPFFSTKQQGRGTGLGLAIVRSIAAQSAAHVAVQSEVGRGTLFRVLFPSSRETPSAPVTSVIPTVRGGNETILLVEDDPWLRELARKILADLGYRVIGCASAAEALARGSVETVDLLVTDVIMPEISGPELARLLTETRPEIAVLFMSGYAEDEIVHRGVVDRGVSLLSKPFKPDALARAVRKQLDEHAVAARKSS